MSTPGITSERLEHPYAGYPAGTNTEERGYLLAGALVALFAWSMLGQKCMLTLAVWLHVPTRVLTIPSHMITLGLAGATLLLVIVAASHRRSPLHWSMLAFAGFWAVYGFRLVVEFLARNSPGAPEPDAIYSIGYVAQRALGSCMIPSLAILANINWGAHRKTQAWCFAMAVLTALAFLGMFKESILHFEGRMQPGDETGEYTTVSALQMGYAGLIVFAFLLHRFFSEQPRTPVRLAVAVAVAAVAVLLVIGSASRGPVIALALMAVPLGASLFARGKRLMGTWFVIACGLLSVAGIVVAELTGSSVFDRLIGMHADVEQQRDTSDRLIYYRLAIDAFAEHPLFGVQTTFDGRAYPHNFLLESLMATGVFGTIPLCIFLGYSLRCAWRILVDAPAMAWVPLSFLAFLGGALFTGSLFTNSSWWVAMAGTISAAHWVASRRADGLPV